MTESTNGLSPIQLLFGHERLQKDLHQIVTGFYRIRKSVYTRIDREPEQQANRERIERERADRGP